MTPQDLMAAFDTLAEAPEGLKRLRELVLQLAVRGKLVPQDPEDEPASVLLERIAAEALVRPAKGVHPVEPDDAAWKLPDSWAWCRLRRVVDFNLGKTPPTKNSAFWSNEGGHAWVSISDMEHYGEVESTRRRVSERAVREVFKGALVPAGTFLMSFKLTIGKVARLAVPAFHNEAIISVFTPFVELDDYLFRMLPLFASGGHTNAAIKGKTLNKGSLTNLLVALPPLAEQKRIVARVDELMGLLDRLEAARDAREATRTALRDAALAALGDADTPEEVEVAWERIAGRMDDLFTTPADVEPLRQTVLQLAVRGRLVPQDPEDEPASLLLQRIAAEKARLVKEKKIRKPNALPPVSEDEMPFGVPDGWKWCRLAALFAPISTSGHKVKTKQMLESGMYPVVDQGQSHIAGYTDDAAKVIAPHGACVVFGDHTRAIKFIDFPFVTGADGVKILQPVATDPRHFFVTLCSYDLTARGYGRHYKLLMEQLFPLPPLAEQKRIVAKVDELMGLLDRLEKHLAHKTTAHDAFAAAAVHHLDA